MVLTAVFRKRKQPWESSSINWGKSQGWQLYILKGKNKFKYLSFRVINYIKFYARKKWKSFVSVLCIQNGTEWSYRGENGRRGKCETRHPSGREKSNLWDRRHRLQFLFSERKEITQGCTRPFINTAPNIYLVSFKEYFIIKKKKVFWERGMAKSFP